MYTDEQQAVIDSTARRLRVLAFAGTGKTTTLVGYARARQEPMLYVAYNRSIAEEARRKFPAHVTCKTAHALAYAVFGQRYRHKLGALRVGDVARLCGVPYRQAVQVLATVTNFLNSADHAVDDTHVPGERGRGDAAERERAGILDAARWLWKSMQDTNNAQVPIPHDGYLKLFAITRPTLPGVVLFDEAQDANPAIGSIILNHAGPLVVTGDHYQAIYGFRGSHNVLTQLPAEQTFALTHSFRFGPMVAGVANHLLAYLGESRRVVGAGPYQDDRLQVDPQRPYAVVARTNMTLVQEAIAATRSGRRVFYVGGIEHMGLDQVWDGYRLYRGDRSGVRDPFVGSFQTLDALEEYATQTGEADWLRVCRIVKTYTHKLPDLIQAMRANAAPSVEQARVVLSTAHRAKGLEFEQVKLGDDFAELVDERGLVPIERLDRQDVHLHYVAATRAMRALQMGEPLMAFVRHCERHRVIAKGPARVASTRDPHNPAGAGRALGQGARP